jgi:hypothetical protein
MKDFVRREPFAAKKHVNIAPMRNLEDKAIVDFSLALLVAFAIGDYSYFVARSRAGVSASIFRAPSIWKPVRLIEAETIDAASTIRLLASIEAFYPMLALIHVFLDNARYHHAKLVQEWLSQPGRRIALHFIPPYCPHLNSIERLWGLMHKHVTHNKCYATCRQFADETFDFLRDKVP